MLRDELVDGAVTFLQDPSVAAAPVEQRIAFLRSKNLTQEEIDASLARVGQSSASPAASSAIPTAQPQAYQPQSRPIPPQYAYRPPPEWWAGPPPEPPRRDWRDWFIMATVLGGVGYALAWTAQRYVWPLISPPTPPQLEQDKANIDAAFDKAFALLDQLASDTKQLKEAETARTERLDAALSEVENVLSRLKEAHAQRDAEAQRAAREWSEIREQIPRAIAAERAQTDAKLQDLTGEMRSLKTLVGNRVAAQTPNPSTLPKSPTASASGVNGSSPSAPTTNGLTPGNATDGTDVLRLLNGGGGGNTQSHADGEAKPPSTPFSFPPDRAASASPYSRLVGNKAQIPSWQLAAQKRSTEQEGTKGGEAASAGEDGGSSG